jgi:hypothetical protein
MERKKAMTDNQTNVIEPHRPAPNPRYMRDDTLIAIDLLLGIERLCDSGDGFTESIKALTIAAVTKLDYLKTDIEGMMK